jgi:hypothetical protein
MSPCSKQAESEHIGAQIEQQIEGREGFECHAPPHPSLAGLAPSLLRVAARAKVGHGTGVRRRCRSKPDDGRPPREGAAPSLHDGRGQPRWVEAPSSCACACSPPPRTATPCRVHGGSVVLAPLLLEPSHLDL